MKPKTTVEKMSVICPFCLKDTGHWMMAKTKWAWNKRTGQYSPQPFDASVSRSTAEFEKKWLQDHRKSGTCLSTVSPKSLKLLGLDET